MSHLGTQTFPPADLPDLPLTPSRRVRVDSHDLFESNGKRVSQRAGTPVISISFGATMSFEVKKPSEKEASCKVLTPLEDGSVLVWSAEDDAKRQHRPFWPWDRKAQASRWVLVCRWVDTLRVHSTTEPYRVVSEKGESWWLPETI